MKYINGFGAHEILDRIDAAIDENQSDCSSETLIKREVYFQDIKYMLNTELC